MMERRGIALGGFMGTGKSSVGTVLAQQLDLPFRDLDEELVRRFGPIHVQFREEGESIFRERETRVLAEICEGPRCVLATGGGAWGTENQRFLRDDYWRVVLTAPFETLRNRLKGDKSRPLWNAEAETLYHTRANIYSQADLIVDSSDLSVNEVATEIMRWLRSQ